MTNNPHQYFSTITRTEQKHRERISIPCDYFDAHLDGKTQSIQVFRSIDTFTKVEQELFEKYVNSESHRNALLTWLAGFSIPAENGWIVTINEHSLLNVSFSDGFSVVLTPSFKKKDDEVVIEFSPVLPKHVPDLNDCIRVEFEATGDISTFNQVNMLFEERNILSDTDKPIS